MIPRIPGVGRIPNLARRPMTVEQREKARARNRAYYRRHKAKILAKGATHQKRRYNGPARDRLLEAARARMKTIRDADPSYSRRRYEKQKNDPVYRAKNAARSREWAKKNPERAKLNHKKNQIASNQRSYLRVKRAQQARPSWANRFFMNEAYDLARRRTATTGFAWHVDHVVPLRSKVVCGLHCERNLSVIPGAHNHSKGNRHWPDMPGA